MPSTCREAECWSRTSVRLSVYLWVSVPSSADKHPQDEETDDEDSEGEARHFVPIDDPSVSLWLALELTGLNNPLHHLMSEEVLIVELLVLCRSYQVGEVVLFLFVHFSVPLLSVFCINRHSDYIEHL